MAKIKKTGRHTGALKATRQAAKRRYQNFETRNGIKTVRKEVAAAVSSKDKAQAQKMLVEAYSKVDKAVKTGVLHWRNAARKKALLARQVKSLSAA